MAKRRKKKSARTSAKRRSEKQSIMLCLYGVITIAISIIGLLKAGVIGVYLDAFMTFLFGAKFYAVQVVYAACIIGGVWMVFHRRLPELETKKLIGIALAVIALLLFAAIPDNKATGMTAWNELLQNGLKLFRQQPIPAQGGLFGGMVYCGVSALFDVIGTYVIICTLVFISLVLLVNGEWVKKQGEQMKEKVSSSIQEANKRREQRKLERLAEEEEEEMEEPDIPVIAAKEPKQEKLSFITLPKKKAAEPDFEEPEEIFSEPLVEEEPEPAEVSETTVTPDTENAEQKYEAYKNYKCPNYRTMLEKNLAGKSNENETAARIKGKQLIEILSEFSIPATLQDTYIGPSVTKFVVKPNTGVLVSRILNIQDNIKMELAAKDIRIEAPIPGRNGVGVEIPNAKITPVRMRELFDAIPEDKKDKRLLVALGKDLFGNPVYGELDRMPHLLVAGATGSGKSVCMNAIICSLLLRTKPDELKLLLIDPKKVEFTQYANVPHLLGPVVSDTSKAANALKVIVTRMDERYNEFSRVGVRKISEYNEYARKGTDPRAKVMPYIVVIIDELADLMTVARKDVETHIQRITQLARAAGIHLVVATQRPSVNVITGTIKTNIPSRIAFTVSSSVDSRTILDQGGAEHLLGSGDMLYVPMGEPAPMRVQGVYVTDGEVEKITSYVASLAKPMYDDAFVLLEDIAATEQGGYNAAPQDPMYDEVVEYVVSEQKCSTSLLQRHFGFGYNRAARMVDILQENGVVGPAQGSKPREVFLKSLKEEE
ncbi:MAG: DNA translocase FtsK 4TM domain-containing protein [Erysipelotrichaceae bacterium]|nr:DNA translocase FtsK 4TM domain-containing protein [Erysipelotrichaceae bacterium]